MKPTRVVLVTSLALALAPAEVLAGVTGQACLSRRPSGRRQAISKTARHVAQRCQKEKRLDGTLAKIELRLRQK